MNANYVTDKILIDWLSYSFPIQYDNIKLEGRVQSDDEIVDEIINSLGMSSCTFFDLRGNRGWTNKKYFGGISIHYGGRPRVWIEMSGQGCRTFEEYGNGDYYSIFRFVMTTQDARFTRIDIAYDSFNGLIDLDEIVKDVHLDNWVSKAGSVYDEWSKKKRHTNKPVEGRCITVGECGSDISMRFYDKGAERGIQDKIDVESPAKRWIRAEIQLRNKHADRFVELLIDKKSSDYLGISLPTDCRRIDHLYFAVVNNFIRFIDCDCNDDSNKWRKPKSQHWSKFTDCHTTHKISLWQKPGTEYNMGYLDNVIEFMFGAPIYTYIQIHGVEYLLRKSRLKFEKNKLPPKYVDLINQFNVKDVDRLDEYFDILNRSIRLDEYLSEMEHGGQKND